MTLSSLLCSVPVLLMISSCAFPSEHAGETRTNSSQPAHRTQAKMDSLAGGSLDLRQAEGGVEGTYQLDSPASRPFTFQEPGYLMNACRF